MRSRIFALVVLPMFAAACRSSTEPSASTLRGTFVVADVNGVALPTAIWTTPTSRIVLVADTMTFDGVATAIRTSTTRQENAGAAPSVNHGSSAWRYTVSGDSIHFEIRCSANENCTGASVGHFVNRNVFTVTSGTTVSLYVRR